MDKEASVDIVQWLQNKLARKKPVQIIFYMAQDNGNKTCLHFTKTKYHPKKSLAPQPKMLETLTLL